MRSQRKEVGQHDDSINNQPQSSGSGMAGPSGRAGSTLERCPPSNAGPLSTSIRSSLALVAASGYQTVSTPSRELSASTGFRPQQQQRQWRFGHHADNVGSSSTANRQASRGRRVRQRSTAEWTPRTDFHRKGIEIVSIERSTTNGGYKALVRWKADPSGRKKSYLTDVEVDKHFPEACERFFANYRRIKSTRTLGFILNDGGPFTKYV